MADGKYTHCLFSITAKKIPNPTYFFLSLDLKYRQKYKDLRKRIREIEEVKKKERLSFLRSLFSHFKLFLHRRTTCLTFDFIKLVKVFVISSWKECE